MKIASITWNEDTDETKIKYTKEFSELPWIVQADILKDVLESAYEQYNDFIRAEITREL